MMVLLTAYLNAGDPPEGDDSEMRERRIEFCNGLPLAAVPLD